jgi:FkbM family methyltransferase
MLFLKKIFMYNFRILQSKTQAVLNKNAYVLFMNTFAKKGVKFGYKNGEHYVTERGIIRYFIKSRGQLYANGLKERTLDLIESYNINKIEFHEGDLIVDVGANVGDLIHYFPNQRYIGFEPSPEEFKALEKNKNSNCEVFNLCIAEEEKQITFYISSAGADSSIYLPLKLERIIEVQSRRLDELIDEPIKLLKIDAEGAEVEVIKGCKRLMGITQFIAIDLGFEKSVKQESTAPPVFEILYSHNFKLIAIAKNERFLFQKLA